IYFRRPADPIAAGRAASEWCVDLLSPDYKMRGAARDALLGLGERGVPQIREMLRKRTPPWQPYVRSLEGFLPFLRERGPDPELARQRGAEMIALLEARGRAAVPELVASLGYSGAAKEAERALLRVGDPAVPGLLRG